MIYPTDNITVSDQNNTSFAIGFSIPFVIDILNNVPPVTVASSNHPLAKSNKKVIIRQL